MSKNTEHIKSDQERIAYVQARRKQEQSIQIILSVFGVLLFFIIWESLVASGLVSGRYLSSPTKVIALFFTKLTDPAPDGATIQINILSSLQVALVGFALAIVIGIPLGWLMGWYKGFDAFARPIFEIIRPIPPVAWIPLTIVWMGIGLRAKAFVVFFSAFVPCLINAYTGIKQTNQTLIDFSKTCGASNWTTFCRIGIPSSLTMVFAGVRIALGNAWATLVAAEMLASASGLGYMILMGRQFARPDLIILGIVVIGAIGVFFTWILGLVENRFLGWKKL